MEKTEKKGKPVSGGNLIVFSIVWGKDNLFYQN